MAKIIPEKVMYFNASYGEKKVYDSLKKLPDDYTVFYSVAWQQKDRVRQNVTWGESDFTILHPNKGILVIEVKSGGISYKNGEWLQTRLDNNITKRMQDPLAQANRSKYRFIDIINEVKGVGQQCAVESVVWFPSISKNVKFPQLPLSYKDEMIFREEDIEDPEKAINKAYNYYNSRVHTNMDKSMVNRIIEQLAPEFDLIESVNSKKEEKEYSFLKLTREQSMLLDYLIEQRKVTIQGTAGTGKTLIAVEEAKRLSDEGRTVLFLCFNHFLCEHLNKNCQYANVKYFNLHRLLYNFSGNYNIKEDEYLEILNRIKDKLYFQDIIIDEAQDLNDDVINFFSNLSDEKDGKFYVFYDKNQLIYQRKNSDWIEMSECKLVLSKNCRNTLQIAITSNNIIDINAKWNENIVNGDMPQIIFAKDKDLTILAIQKLIKEYKSKGFKNNEITILTTLTEEKSVLNGQEYIGDDKIVKEIDNENIFFTSSRKFKGLESNVVIIVDVEKEEFSDHEKKRNLYVAASRAKHKLDIIVNASEEEIDDIAKQISTVNIKNSIAKIATKLKVKPVKI